MELEKTEPAGSSAGPDLITKDAPKIAVELPQDVAEAVKLNCGDLSQYVLEMLAVEGYRSGVLTPEQLHRLLSLKQHS